MSRAGSKTGGKDKQGKPAPVLAQHPVAAPDIVPGRFSEHDWFLMLERDSVVDFVLDFIDEILAQTMQSIHKLSISKQMVPFTVYQALTDVMHIVEWKFLDRDDGERSVAESDWVQDEEPTAAVLDSWAQGAVPRTETITSYLVEEDLETSSKASRKATREGKEVDAELLDASGKEPDTEPDQEKERILVKKKARPKGIAPKKKAKAMAAFVVTQTEEQPSKEPEMADLSESVPSIGSVLMAPKLPSYQSSNQTDNPNVKFDETGNVVSVNKLDADTLPSHRVWVKFQLVDPSEEAEKVVKSGHSSHHHSAKASQPHKSANSESLTAVKFLTKTRKFTPLDPPPSVWENIKIAPGVAISECGRSKKFAGKISQVEKALNFHLKALHPISLALRDKSNTVSVSDLLDLNSPVIRALDDSKPLPPISRVSSRGGEGTDEKTYEGACKGAQLFSMRVTD